MRTIIATAAGTLGGLVLLFTYPTSTNSAVLTAPPGGSATGAAGAPGAAGSGPGSTGSTGTPGASGGTGSASGTFTGDAVDTRWGVVQVQITVENGTITKAEAVQYPQDNHRDQEINAYALPILAQAATTAQSARIDAVSGATVTSDGYIQSLQSAIDQAHR